MGRARAPRTTPTFPRKCPEAAWQLLTPGLAARGPQRAQASRLIAAQARPRRRVPAGPSAHLLGARHCPKSSGDAAMSSNPPKVAYYYDKEVGNFYYGQVRARGGACLGWKWFRLQQRGKRPERAPRLPLRPPPRPGPPHEAPPYADDARPPPQLQPPQGDGGARRGCCGARGAAGSAMRVGAASAADGPRRPWAWRCWRMSDSRPWHARYPRKATCGGSIRARLPGSRSRGRESGLGCASPLGTCQPLLSRPSAADSAPGAPCPRGAHHVPLRRVHRVPQTHHAGQPGAI